MELPNAKLFKNEELIILNYSISSLYSTPPMIAKFELKEQSLKIAWIFFEKYAMPPTNAEFFINLELLKITVVL